MMTLRRSNFVRSSSNSSRSAFFAYGHKWTVYVLFTFFCCTYFRRYLSKVDILCGFLLTISLPLGQVVALFKWGPIFGRLLGVGSKYIANCNTYRFPQMNLPEKCPIGNSNVTAGRSRQHLHWCPAQKWPGLHVTARLFRSFPWKT